MGPSRIQHHRFRCQVAKVPAIATVATFVITGIGEPGPALHRDYACDHAAVCEGRGFWDQRPVRRKSAGG